MPTYSGGVVVGKNHEKIEIFSFFQTLSLLDFIQQNIYAIDHRFQLVVFAQS